MQSTQLGSEGAVLQQLQLHSHLLLLFLQHFLQQRTKPSAQPYARPPSLHSSILCPPSPSDDLLTLIDSSLLISLGLSVPFEALIWDRFYIEKVQPPFSLLLSFSSLLPYLSSLTIISGHNHKYQWFSALHHAHRHMATSAHRRRAQIASPNNLIPSFPKCLFPLAGLARTSSITIKRMISLLLSLLFSLLLSFFLHAIHQYLLILLFCFVFFSLQQV